MMETELRFRPIQRQVFQRRQRATTMFAPPNISVNIDSAGKSDEVVQPPPLSATFTRERSLTSIHPSEYTLGQSTLISPSSSKRYSTASSNMTIDEDDEPSEQTQLRDALELMLSVAIESASQLHAHRMDIGLKAEEQLKTLASVMGYKLEPVSSRSPFMAFPLEIMYRIMSHITDKSTLAKMTHLSQSFQSEAEKALYSEVLIRSHNLDPAPLGFTVLPLKVAKRKHSLWERVGPYVLVMSVDMRSQTGMVMGETEAYYDFIRDLLPTLRDCRSLTLHIPEVPNFDRPLKHFVSPSFFLNVHNLRHFGTTLRVVENEVLRALMNSNPQLNSLSFGDMRYTFSLPSEVVPPSLKSVSIRRHKYFLTPPQLSSILSLVQSQTESMRLDLSFDSETVLPPILTALRRAPGLKRLVMTYCTWNLISVHFLERVTMYAPMVRYYGTMCVTCDLMNDERVFPSLIRLTELRTLMVRFANNDIASVHSAFIPFLERARKGGCKQLRRIIATRVTHKINAWGTWVRHERKLLPDGRVLTSDGTLLPRAGGRDFERLGLYGGVTPDGSAEWIWRECHPIHADVLWELETRELGDDLKVRGY